MFRAPCWHTLLFAPRLPSPPIRVALTHHPSYSQGKARLGTVVHKKTATALALTAVKNEDQREFAKLVESFKVRGVHHSMAVQPACGTVPQGKPACSSLWRRRKGLHTQHVTRCDCVQLVSRERFRGAWRCLYS